MVYDAFTRLVYKLKLHQKEIISPFVQLSESLQMRTSCEVDPDMECGWERIYQRLKAVGRLDALKCPVQIRNYATDSEVNK